MTPFYKQSKEIIEDIRRRVVYLISNIEETRVRNVLLQRTKSASFIKGVLAYHIHKGLGGRFDKSKRIDLSSKIEIFCSSGAILDNVIDKHEERNRQTTYLKEYGLNIQIASSQYALHLGLRYLFPFLGTFCEKFSDRYKVDQAVLGMIRTDINKSSNIEEHLNTIELSNGLFNQIPLVMVASIVTDNNLKVDAVGDYGLNLGITLGIYEELRDLFGEHGRRRATEIENGRVITPLLLEKEADFSYFLGKHLNEDDYNMLLRKLNKSGAIEKTRDLILSYSQKAIISLMSAVNKECVDNIKPLHDSIQKSIDSMLDKKFYHHF